MTLEKEDNYEGGWFDHFKLSSRDRALFLADERDFDAQLIAIRGALRRNKQAELAVTEKIQELDDFIGSYDGGDVEYQMHLDDTRIDVLHESVFQDAAHSMAAVGMLAPFVESLFVSMFEGIRSHRERKDPKSKPDIRLLSSETDFWNPRFVFNKKGRRGDIVRGIAQLSESVGLTPFLPEDFDRVLQALFEYRNKMFHHGFEWPLEERQRFDKRIQSSGWPVDWFKKSSTGGDPWIFYMSDVLIEECLALIDQVLEGVGDFLGSTNSEK